MSGDDSDSWDCSSSDSLEDDSDEEDDDDDDEVIRHRLGYHGLYSRF